MDYIQNLVFKHLEFYLKTKYSIIMTLSNYTVVLNNGRWNDDIIRLSNKQVKKSDLDFPSIQFVLVFRNIYINVVFINAVVFGGQTQDKEYIFNKLIIGRELGQELNGFEVKNLFIKEIKKQFPDAKFSF